MTNTVKFLNVYEENESFGGHEEGGWYYTDRELVHSVLVTVDEDLKERRQALENYIKHMGYDDLFILVEDTEGETVTKTPQWS